MKQFIYLLDLQQSSYTPAMFLFAVGIAAALSYVLGKLNFYKHPIKTALGASLICSSFLVVFLLQFFGAIFVNESCNQTIARGFNIFNAHIKDLCLEREDKSQCPHDRSELKAFNPKIFNEVEACTQTYYRYDEKNQQGYWTVSYEQGMYLVSGSR